MYRNFYSFYVWEALYSLMNKAPLKKRNHSQIYASAELSINQGRRQGVCWGGGGAKCLAEHFASSESGGMGGGGGDSDTFFRPTI